MSKYVSPNGISGVSGYEQSLVFHYRMDVDRTMFGRWFVNVFDHGVLYYVPDPDTDTSPSTAGGTDITIKAGTSFLIKQKESTDGDIIAKGDMVKDYAIDVSGYAAATYSLIAIWENAAEEYRGVEFYLYTAAEIAVLDAAGYNYIKFGEVVISGGVIDSNTTTNQTQGSMYSGLAGWSGYSGTSGYSGWSGKSGWSGYSSYSGTSGYSGPSGYSGYSSLSGWSGYSSHSGYSGISGWSGETPSVSECMIVAASDEITPITTGTAKVTFRIPYDFTLTTLKGSLTTAGSTATIVDVHLNGTSIFTGKPQLTIASAGYYADATVFSDSNFNENDKLEVNVGSAGTGAAGLKVYFIGTKT
jgi:hypothetical protein